MHGNQHTAQESIHGDVHLTNLSSRLSQVSKRAKTEADIVAHSWHKDLLEQISGKKETWFKPEHEDSEWGYIRRIFKARDYSRIIRISTVTVGSVLFPGLGGILYVRFLIGSEKENYSGSEYRHYNQMDNEEWWYVNGTGVNTDLQMANARHLAGIAKKEIKCYYNPTTGLVVDFIQSMVGLLSYNWTPSTRLAKALLKRFEENPTGKTILVVHSMGAIIAANAVKFLIRNGLTDDLHRLEIYTFGSPALEFLSIIHPVHKIRVPHYEHYVNTKDYFGSIGAGRLLMEDTHWTAGRVYVRKMTGHFLGEHYLPGIAAREYKHNGHYNQSHLYDQMNKGNAREAQRLQAPQPLPQPQTLPLTLITYPEQDITLPQTSDLGQTNILLAKASLPAQAGTVPGLPVE